MSDTISATEALRVAQEDAQTAYRHLTHYQIRVALKEDGWHIAYDLIDPRAKGGGPHYLIHPSTAAILSKRYEQ